MPNQEVEKYAHDVAGLVELCRRVISRIVEIGKDRTIEKQFKAVEGSIRSLEQQHVPVPDALRAEKVRLGACLADIQQTDYRATLGTFAGELEKIACEVCKRIGATPLKKKPDRPKKPGRKRRDPGMLRTPNERLREMIVAVLKRHGGAAAPKAVIVDIAEMVDGKWFPGDLVLRKDGRTVAWENNVRWETMRMKKDGTLQSNGEKGVWALSKGEVVK